MEDGEIYQLASQVLGEITRDLNTAHYASLGGELCIHWGTEKKFGAFASSSGDIAHPPKHTITIYYEFARQLWRDVESFCEFMQTIPGGSGLDKLYDFYGDRKKLPSCFTPKEHVHNMFLAALTWVYFHEFGHLSQEHGLIRAEFGHSGGMGRTTDIHDFEAYGDSPLSDQDALISHVIELAADFEATNIYVLELIRHMREPGFSEESDRNEVFSGLIYLMVCGISLVFLRFNGAKPILPMVKIMGSHPSPLVRLEMILPQIFERLDEGFARVTVGHEIDRRQLVILCQKAAFSATLYWSLTRTKNKEFDNRLMLKGLLTDSVILEYLRPIVESWDEMVARVNEIRRISTPFGIMTFSETFRTRIAEVLEWGKGPEKNDT